MDEVGKPLVRTDQVLSLLIWYEVQEYLRKWIEQTLEREVIARPSGNL
jgi:hypothetical protein